MASWSQNPIATYTGSWTISNSIPGAALDTNGNLLIVWADNTDSLYLSYTPPDSQTLTPVKVAEGTQGSPSAVFVNGSFYVFWRSSPSGQLNYGIVNSASLSQFTSQGLLDGANSNDGPQVAVDQLGQTVWVAWRGVDPDQSLYFSSLKGTDWNVNFLQGGPALNSFFSPAVGFLPNASGQPADLCTVYRGAGSGDDGDPTLYSSYCQLDSAGSFQPNVTVENYSTTNRPSLVVFPQGNATGSVLVVFQSGSALFSTTASFDAGFGPWSNQQLIPASFLNLPMGVLVTQPGQNSSVYLLLFDFDANSNIITNVLYLYQYS